MRPAPGRIKHNTLHAIFLLVVMTGLLCLVGWMLAGRIGLVFAFSVTAFSLFANPRWSPRLILKMYKARQIMPAQAPGLFKALQLLADKAGLTELPELYYIPSPLMNAFSVGNREQAAIGLTDGLLQQLSFRELVAIIGHEISHITNNDMKVMGLADLVSRMTGSMSLAGQILLLISLPMYLQGKALIPFFPLMLLILAPTISALLQLALSRNREYDADLDGALFTGDPEGLVSALQKLEHFQGGFLEQILMPGRKVPHPSILRSHPATEDRIGKLLSLDIKKTPIAFHSHFDQTVAIPAEWRGQVRKPRWRPGGMWY